ncbi:MAG TPA: GNAT family protein [Fluviicoccus sp.]|nr:GNAT family protein [Fluviicoccus sp.]
MTTRLIYGEEHRLLPWARERIGIHAFRRDAYTIGLERHGELVAVVVYDGFSDVDVNMHIASDGTRQWMSKELLVAAFAYPFIQLGMRRVTGMVPASNKQALAFDEHLGFVREGYHPNAMPGDDIVSLGLLRENCRFIPKEYR